MSGHSKWHNIQGKKGKADKARGNIFTKLAKAITIAAQHGGGDPEMNFSLRIAIEKAKATNMPKDNIEKAIKRGVGELDGGAQLQELVYEGFGPSGVAVLVEALTDNSNRTASEIKHVFGRFGGSLGGPGSVQWQFQHLGVIHLGEIIRNKIQETKDDFELALIDAGADDIIDNETDIEIRCAMEKFSDVVGALKKIGIEPDDSGLEWIAKECVKLDDEASVKVGKFYDALDELDDVENIYTNES